MFDHIQIPSKVWLVPKQQGPINRTYVYLKEKATPETAFFLTTIKK